MCLLVTQTAGVVFDTALLEDIYGSNPDGIGVMYPGPDDTVRKCVPTSFAEFRDFYHAHIAGRVCAWHARMRTHGDVDLTNCHPYEFELPGGTAQLMHNGVLHSGNDADRSKSDTWHYIRDVLQPLLTAAPQLATTPAFVSLIEENIGRSNKFVLRMPDGEMVTFNAASGVRWERSDGVAWMSNTYAWDAGFYLGYGTRRGATTAKLTAFSSLANLFESDMDPAESWSASLINAMEHEGMNTDELDEDVLALAYDYNPDQAEDLLDDAMYGIATEAEIHDWVKRAAIASVTELQEH